MLTWLADLPGFLRFLIYVIVAVIVVIVLALIVSKLGGFDEHFQLGHFHVDIGTS
jgi:hypothetical protein